MSVTDLLVKAAEKKGLKKETIDRIIKRDFNRMSVVNDKYSEDIKSACREMGIPCIRVKNNASAVFLINNKDAEDYRSILKDVYSEKDPSFFNIKPSKIIDMAHESGCDSVVRLSIKDRDTAKDTVNDLLKDGILSGSITNDETTDVYICDKDLYKKGQKDFSDFELKYALRQGIKASPLTLEDGTAISPKALSDVKDARDRYDTDTYRLFSEKIKAGKNYILCSLTEENINETPKEPYIESSPEGVFLYNKGRKRPLPVKDPSMTIDDITRFVADTGIKDPSILRKRDFERMQNGIVPEDIHEHLSSDNVNGWNRDEWNFDGLSPKVCQAAVYMDKFVISALEDRLEEISRSFDEKAENIPPGKNYLKKKDFIAENLEATVSDIRNDHESESYKNLIIKPVSLWNSESNVPVGASALAETVTNIVKTTENCFTDMTNDRMTIENVSITENLVNTVMLEEDQTRTEEAEKEDMEKDGSERDSR